MKKIKKYFDLLRERGKEKRITKSYQITGLEIAKILGDEEHKSLYIKLAKEGDDRFLLGLAKDIADRKNIENRGAYFMTMLKKHKNNEDNNNR